MNHAHNVKDDDSYFVVEPSSRMVVNADGETTTIMQYDHNSERLVFEIPRYIEGHDMMLCDSVRVHFVNTSTNKSFGSSKSNVGVYEVSDLQISDDDNVLLCSWLVSQDATQFIGTLSFIIRFVCTENGSVVYAWNTAIYSNIIISDGIYNGDDIVTKYPDVLEQWKAQINTMLTTSMAILDKQNEQIANNIIVKVEQTAMSTVSGGINTWTITFSDGSTATLNVRNGANGRSSFVIRDVYSDISALNSALGTEITPEQGDMYLTENDLSVYMYDDAKRGFVNLGPLGVNPSPISCGNGENSAEMSTCSADGNNSTAIGIGTKTTTEAQLAAGKYNAENPNALFTLGCGTDDENRENALEIISDESGNTVSIKLKNTILTEAQLIALISALETFSLGTCVVSDNEAGGQTYTITGTKEVSDNDAGGQTYELSSTNANGADVAALARNYVVLTDQSTGSPYKMYIENGQVMIEEVVSTET